MRLSAPQARAPAQSTGRPIMDAIKATLCSKPSPKGGRCVYFLPKAKTVAKPGQGERGDQKRR